MVFRYLTRTFDPLSFAGVAWNLGTSRGQLAPEPRQLDGVHCNQKKQTKNAHSMNYRAKREIPTDETRPITTND